MVLSQNNWTHVSDLGECRKLFNACYAASILSNPVGVYRRVKFEVFFQEVRNMRYLKLEMDPYPSFGRFECRFGNLASQFFSSNNRKTLRRKKPAISDGPLNNEFATGISNL